MADEKTNENKLDQEFAEFKHKLFMRLAETSAGFFETDHQIMISLQGIFDTIDKGLKEKQGDLFSDAPNTRIDIDALRAAFEARTKDVGPGDIAGSDIVGGGPGWLTELGEFINSVGDFIKYEKKTFLAILLLIFCKDCHCVCEFINKPD